MATTGVQQRARKTSVHIIRIMLKSGGIQKILELLVGHFVYAYGLGSGIKLQL